MACTSSEVRAHGAVAEAEWKDGNKFGALVRAYFDPHSVDEARAGALEQCREGARGKKLVIECRIVGTSRKQCYSGFAAPDKDGGSAAMGWAIAPLAIDAERKARELCRTAAGSRADDCRSVGVPICDQQRGGDVWAGGRTEGQFPKAFEFDPRVVGGLLGVLIVGGAAWAAIAFFVQRGGADHGSRVEDRRLGAADPTGMRRFADEGAARGAAPTQVAPPAPPSVLLVPKGGGAPLILDARRMARGGLVIGRGANADVVVADPAVSGRHARVWIDEKDRLRVEDLRSANGTFRNGQRVERASLANGDVLKLAGVEFVVRC